MDQPKLGIAGFCYADLHQPAQLKRLYASFCDWLQQRDISLAQRYNAWIGGAGLDAKHESELLLALAPHLSSFIARLFLLESECNTKAAEVKQSFDTLFAFRQQITLKLDKHAKAISGSVVESLDDAAIKQRMMAMLAATKTLHPEDEDGERLFSNLGLMLLAGNADAARIGSALPKELFATGDVNELFAILVLWCIRACENPKFAPESEGWTCLKSAQRTDTDNLVPHHEDTDAVGYRRLGCKPDEQRHRDGFALTDRRFGLRRTLYEVDHCIYCHERGTDSCSHGMRDRKSGSFKVNAMGNNVIGCPLEERISEMNLMKRQGDNIAALALVMIDNPMCPGTGHRICNDCMKGCIYQKTEPVDIPQIETHVLTEVLFMPWGFEIYGLLSRFNPLNRKRPYALPYNGHDILVVGLGPAGYTLAHYLANEGFGVVGIDALKIEPLAKELLGNGQAPQAVRDFRELYMELDQRPVNGFGGVAEYGITSRWDKNFLTVIYLTLARRNNFRCYGNIRFGGTLTIEDAWQFGFEHIAMAAGAGKPTMIGMQGNMVRGIRMASDFLMALQLGGAAREGSLANLQIRMPVGVIGGGLTGIDTATEALAYYPAQVEKILYRWEKLCQTHSPDTLRQDLDEEELAILDEFLQHATEIRELRQQARQQGQPADINSLLRKWGGATMFYRKDFKSSPAYRLNHEEVREALAEGIYVADNMSPVKAITDNFGALRTVRFSHKPPGQQQAKQMEVPLRSLFIAAGTKPNTIYEQEHPYTFRMRGDGFQHYQPEVAGTGSYLHSDGKIKLNVGDDSSIVKQSSPAPFTSYSKDGRSITFYGDMHPVYAGSVVKAMASARDGYPYITRIFADRIARQDPAIQEQREQKLATLFKQLDGDLLASVAEVERLAPNIVNVVVQAPAQARAFAPGQFYRVQNYATLSSSSGGTKLAAEGLALTGASVNKDKGLISLITLEMGGSSRLCAHWQPGDPIALMGVTGQATEISGGQTVLMVGGGLGNAVLFSIGRALRDADSKVLYFAGYRERAGVFRMDDIEAAADVVVWAVDSGQAKVEPRREQDKSFSGNIVQAMLAYASGELGATTISTNQASHLIAIGSDKMMAAVKQARHTVLKPYLRADHTAIGSINSPMQCMMKGVCAQCLCRHINQDTGEEYFVYSCYNQDQNLDHVDFDHLNARLRQNSLQEKITSRWLDLVLPPT